ncbi:pseudouridine-metabolizing bifunctional protein C1861.05 [Scaptodrosophila lebanonensis]|uniref:Pseudouridine-metabolizing bifunctional protein C1861.05 n=1 Tax=Drosophila lebanonensis TaxID=7225 RepID=A0A6J2U7B4_DROLE|nr:pseudouridine-metabolizing bifunctional protein C1861.05 [Scaptodrosophila lebanonensis]
MHFLRICAKNFVPRVTRHLANVPRKPHIVVHPDVQHALQHDHPIVALESTIITHGMPHPENVETALQVEEQVRSNGAVPATIGIIDGSIKVGLTKDELTELARKPQEQVIKCSRRDLPYVVAMRQSGGTTVAATMIVAYQVGIKIFATGGIGGVHREGNVTMDVSADLVELGRTPVAVICSGVKSILDIPRTLEFLETQGVCVATYDSPDGLFPDFYTRDSGCKVPYNLPSAKHAAEMLRAWRKLKLYSGVLIGVPIPSEFAADKTTISAAIQEAHLQAKAQGITGKEVTPFLLAAISRITKGSSLKSNIALIKNNAAVAAQIANALAARHLAIDVGTVGGASNTRLKKPIVVGASILDLSLTVNENKRDMKLDGATYTANAKQAAGGVGRNIAEAIYKLYGDVNLISAIGKDQLGKSLLEMMPAALQRGLVVDKERSTSLCSIIFDKFGDCKLILGNMEIHNSITAECLEAHTQLFAEAPLIVMDSNVSTEAMKGVLQQAQKYKLPVFFEPTDMFIAGKPFTLPRELTQHIRIVKPNKHELMTIVEAITGQKVNYKLDGQLNKSQLLQQTRELLKQIESHFNCIIATLGDHGVLISFRSDAAQDARLLLDLPIATPARPKLPHNVRFYAAPMVPNIINVSGAGDSFCAGFITALLRARTLDECVAAGFVAAERALQSESAVPKTYFRDNEAFESRYKQVLTTLQQQQCI